MKFLFNIRLLMIALTIIAIPPLALAQLNSGTITSQECVSDLGILCSGRSDNFGHIAGFLFLIIRGFLQLIAVVAFGVLVYCGAMYIMSRGDQELARRAKMCIVYAIIGIIVAGFSGILVNSTINLWR